MWRKKLREEHIHQVFAWILSWWNIFTTRNVNMNLSFDIINQWMFVSLENEVNFKFFLYIFWLLISMCVLYLSAILIPHFSNRFRCFMCRIGESPFKLNIQIFEIKTQKLMCLFNIHSLLFFGNLWFSSLSHSLTPQSTHKFSFTFYLWWLCE